MSAILGGLAWVATIAWYAQQPVGDDDLKEGWDAFNRAVTLIPLLFAAPLYSMRVSIPRAARPVLPRSLVVVVASIVVAAIVRLLVDLDVMPSPFAFLAIGFFTLAFLWYLVATLRAGTFPRVALSFLLASTLLMLGSIGTETSGIWLASRFGLAWVVVGVWLLLWCGD